MNVAVLGLGAMGAPIARRLEAAGFGLTVYNRSPGPGREFAERGVQVARTPAAACAGVDVCVSMLSDGPAVETVLGEVLAAPSPPNVVIDMSTIDVTSSTRVAERIAQAGVAYVRAPVSGNPGVVAAGRLVILASGDHDAFTAVRPVLDAIGPTVLHLGAGEEARVMKLALNLMVAGTMQLLAEALVMGEGHGLDRGQMLEVIGGSVVGSPFAKYKAEPLIADDYSTTFAARLMHKDLGLVLDCADAAGVPVPIAATVQQLLRACIGAGLGELDFAVLVAKLQQDAGQRKTLPQLV
ncbi:NAD(P)-dependent oxidoreductase [Solirubrobacter soli]|uniref:NAD(P)-dependent oxidoreductase n=1 Tax=Solirubrobacter soli TaxID=363832 RepID=UPI000408C7FA|nr:NAD(P)-dependent oxidoreductase [Solirubrobacter soli]